MNTRDLLIKANEIEEMEGVAKTHFLNPNAQRLNKSLGDMVGLQNLGVHIIYVEPGKETTEYHKHYHEEECIFVLSGKGKLNIENDTYLFEKGDFVGFPVNTASHSLTNHGDTTLICLVIGQRLEFDIGDYPNKSKRIYRNNGIWDLVDWDNIIDPRNKPRQ